ncbi:MAG: hypothetical protein B6D34_01045 [Candidatus Brocadia sp. UTAMX1]|jgi:hypothetical protein|nr:MAG: hypothetical protein B6D34_01045 [Candidatus Brocadia sp. UTAMX1]
MKTGAEKSSTTTSAAATRTANRPFFSKTGEGGFFTPQRSTIAPFVQMKMAVNKPGDKLEQEADKMAGKVMRMPSPASTEKKNLGQTDEKLQNKEKKEEEKIQKAAASEEKLQRDGSGAPALTSDTQSAIQGKTTGGQPLSTDVRGFMEPRFHADFGNVRIHSDAESAGLSNQLSARAFTYQNHIFFSRDQYQPGTSEGRQLLAHELTHTIQQGHSIQRSPQVSTTTAAPPIQRFLGIDIPSWQDVIDWLAEKAYNIPGYRMFTIVIGVNPINGEAADRSAANILRAIVEFLPGGKIITDALEKYNVFEKAGSWVEGKLKRFSNLLGTIKSAIGKFIDDLDFLDIILHPVRTWERAVSIFTKPANEIIDFIGSIFQEILQFIRDAVLMPLAALAKNTRGFDLLCALLGKNPITKEPVPRTPDTLIGGFMKLIGQEEIWENIKKGNAVQKAWQWFQNAMQGLFALVSRFPEDFIAMLKSLEVMDFIILPNLFAKVIKVFGNFILDFYKWALNTVLDLLEIIFTVVAPKAVPYVAKAKSTFITIIKNPVGFVGNLVRAGKMGFEMFKERIGEHLKAALINWLVGPLAEAGVYIPKSFTLIEIVKLVLSVLGLTWQNIRSKLVKIIPEPVLVVLEKTAGILVTLVKDGPAAAWEQIKAELSELKDQLITQITQMISVEVVKAAVMKLISMLNPAGAVIQAIIAIYNTISFFIQKIQQIAAVVASFIDSVSAIAAGQVANAAKKVEQTMANTLTVVIAFLAKFAGLGGIPDKIVGIVKKIRQPIDKGLDKIVAWLGTMFKKAGETLFSWAFAKTSFSEADGKSHSIYVEGDEIPRLMIASNPKDAEAFLNWYLSEKKDPKFEEKNSGIINRIRDHIVKAKAIVQEIANLRKKGAEWKARQQDLLKKNVELSRDLSKLVGDDRSIGKAIEKYKLEGMAGTYGSIPKPPGDDFTADHQPQAAVLIAASKFDFFSKDGNLNERSEKRAHQGYAINLHKARHMAGATYGYKGKETKESFLSRVKPAVKDKPPAEQRKAVIMLLKSDLRRDVAAIKSVVKSQYDAPIWNDVREKTGNDKEAGKKLVGEIRVRIVAGEDQIANQDLDSLAK